jgi:hypothetical protein
LDGRRTVEHQRQLVAHQKATGRDTTSSEALLATFERSLAIFEDHLRAIMEKRQRNS